MRLDHGLGIGDLCAQPHFTRRTLSVGDLGRSLPYVKRAPAELGRWRSPLPKIASCRPSSTLPK
jgi:hypothetical protein